MGTARSVWSGKRPKAGHGERGTGAYPDRSVASVKPIPSGGPRGGDDRRSVGGAGAAADGERVGGSRAGVGAPGDAAGDGRGLGRASAAAIGGALSGLWRDGESPRRQQS